MKYELNKVHMYKSLVHQINKIPFNNESMLCEIVECSEGNGESLKMQQK